MLPTLSRHINRVVAELTVQRTNPVAGCSSMLAGVRLCGKSGGCMVVPTGCGRNAILRRVYEANYAALIARESSCFASRLTHAVIPAL